MTSAPVHAADLPSYTFGQPCPECGAASRPWWSSTASAARWSGSTITANAGPAARGGSSSACGAAALSGGRRVRPAV